MTAWLIEALAVALIAALAVNHILKISAGALALVIL